MPAHAPYVASSGKREAGSGAPVFPLAVRHYNRLAWQADPLMPVSPDCEMPFASDLGIEKAISVIIDAGQGSADLANCLAAIENQIGAERIDVILAGWPEDAPLPACELNVRTIDGRELTLAGRLNAAAQMSDADRLMFLAPGVLLSDPRTAAVLSRLADRPGTASVACALVTELHDQGEAKVHSAGYFPTRVSLLGEPVFDFSQFDIARTMPAATFPVVANHAKCVLYDAATFRSLGGFDQQRFPMAMHDLDLGFRALAAGQANLCTSLVRAAIDEAALNADFPDPLAHRSVRPADWQSLFDRVTVVRELRR
jgi:Predicted glycosyltransferases